MNTIQSVIIGSIALFFSLITFNNLIDFGTNWEFIKHVFSHPTALGRAIHGEQMTLIAYWFIIFWEGITALFLWIGALGRSIRFAQAGLLMGFLLFFVGFVIIASEWFFMWQSVEGMQGKALLFSIFLLSALTYVRSKNPA